LQDLELAAKRLTQMTQTAAVVSAMNDCRGLQGAIEELTAGW
jgi:hypothetical protein